MTRTNSRKRKNWQISEDGTLHGPVYRGQKREKKGSISSNTKGFLLIYKGQNHEEVVSTALLVLNKYSDKLYRSDEKSCHFNVKLRVLRESTVFIESDIDDPHLLADAIITDLHAEDKDIEILFKSLLQLLPIDTTCVTNSIEEILRSVKGLVEPVAADQDKNPNHLFRMCVKGPCRHFSDKFLPYLETLRMAEAKVDREKTSELVICVKSLGDESGKVLTCFISLLRNFSKFKGYNIRRILGSDVEETDESRVTRMVFLKTSISSSTRGFLLSFSQKGAKYTKILDTFTRLLNEHAEKIYDRTCYFENKILKHDSGQSPIFIESDIDDPSVLVEAIFADLKAAMSVKIDVEHWLRLLPVNLTCTAEYGEIISKVKTVLEPVMSKQKSDGKTGIGVPGETNNEKVQTFNVVCIKGCFAESDAEKIVEGITEHLVVLGLQKSEPRTHPDISISLRTFRKICCISLLPSFSEFMGYSISNIVKDKVVEKEADSNEVEGSVNSNEVEDSVNANEIEDSVNSDGQKQSADTSDGTEKQVVNTGAVLESEYSRLLSELEDGPVEPAGSMIPNEKVAVPTEGPAFVDNLG